MDINESLLEVFRKLDWRLDDTARSISRLCGTICEKVDAFVTTENSDIMEVIIGPMNSLLTISRRVYSTGDAQGEGTLSFRSARNSFSYYCSRVMRESNNNKLPTLFGVAYSSLNLFFAYCAFINPIRDTQSIAYFFQSCPFDQNQFRFMRECESIIDLCINADMYPIIRFAINPDAFCRVLRAYVSRPINLIHFAAHGNAGKLVFCTSGSFRSAIVTPDYVLDCLSGASSGEPVRLPLVYVNACHSDSFAARMLLRLNANVIVRRAIGIAGINLDYHANCFSESFYGLLALFIAGVAIDPNSLCLSVSRAFHKMKNEYTDAGYARKVFMAKRRKNG